MWPTGKLRASPLVRSSRCVSLRTEYPVPCLEGEVIRVTYFVQGMTGATYVARREQVARFEREPRRRMRPRQFSVCRPMDIPTVPTDNLYKFMAIIGLLLVVVGIFLPLYFEFRYATL